ncbi:general substrate transporter [Pseudomassariella vexata]|uniref:General substrate transporter n=1 Tax=Pseudomassariella vexata TaxID=1141098 RepID=A0A1Y2EK47_9PEZI|nr:general substrate transporter [Pseudomassariella vexata]ORY71664.1 general substrate transporter [Pseudomassariella vexata]
MAGVAENGVADNIVHRMAIEDKVPWYRKKNLRYLYFMLFPCLMGIEMTSGFDSQVINAVQIVPAWNSYFGHPQGGLKGILASALPLGSCIGLPLIPYVNDGFGRRWCVMFGSVIMIIGSLIQGFSINAPMYIISRLIIGFGLPYAIVAGSSLIGELAYPKERAIMTSLFNAAYFIGAIVAAGITFGTQTIASDWSWRVPSLLQMSPSIFQVSLIFFLPESPRYLISQDRHEEALKILVKYHGEGDEASEFVKAEMAEIKTTMSIEMDFAKRSWLDMVNTAGNRRRLAIGALVGVMTQLSGNVVISYYTSDILAMVGYTDPAFQAKFNIGNQCSSGVFASIAALVVMRFRRRTMYLTSILSILVIYVAWTISAAEYLNANSQVAAKLCLFWIYAYQPCYNIGFNALTYTFLVEVFPYASRARGLAVYQFFGKAAQFFGTNVNPVGLDPVHGIGYKFLIVYCCWIAVEAFLIWWLWPETSNRTLEELTFLFEDEERAHRATAAVEKQIHHEDAGPRVSVKEEA